MCLALPKKIVEISGLTATLQDKRVVRLDLLAKEDVTVGDYVLVSADLAVEKLSEEKALAMAEIMNCDIDNEV